MEDTTLEMIRDPETGVRTYRINGEEVTKEAYQAEAEKVIAGYSATQGD